ncbi:MAG: hypothetical protein NTW14_13355 [bacterium]|nr:hypothetical protein [bacterium]
MKIIFSRKGFDSSNGCKPSPIMPDGSLCSLPIPSDDKIKYSDVSFKNMNLGVIVSSLTKDQIQPDQNTHLDPDLRFDAIKRHPGWRPAFGQVDQAQTHLENHYIDCGDLFLFFGWFRQADYDTNGLVYQRGSKSFHLLFGWLQIGEIFKPSTETSKIPDWAYSHPHVQGAMGRNKNNTLYIASKQLCISGTYLNIAGGGIFSRFTDELRLSTEGNNRSRWQLPKWFYPSDGKPPLSYHSDLKRWQRQDSNVLINTVGRGQEFVLDCDYYPEAIGRLNELFTLVICEC